MKKFSDFSEEEKALDGDKEKIDSITNQKIIITGFKVRNSRYSKNKSGNYLTLQFEHNKKTFVCFTGSDVLIDQVLKYKQEMPFETVIKKINRYYTFT